MLLSNQTVNELHCVADDLFTVNIIINKSKL